VIRRRIRPSRDRVAAAVAFGVPVVLVAVLHGWAGTSLVGSSMLLLLVAKLVVARRERRRGRNLTYRLAPSLAVAAVVPMHNEDPDLAVAAIRSMLAQTRPIARIHVVDDGSTDGGAAADAVEQVLRHQDSCRDWIVTRLARNVGKRNAMAVAFRAAPDADVFLCVDSDTVLDVDAVEHGLKPFADPTVSAVAGLVLALNWRRNLLTRLIDLRYVSAFLAERAAYSYFGAVLCCCGSLSFYRSHVVREHLDDFVDQRFLGRTATFGDDRRLTNYALRSGRVVLVEQSRAQTAVPERLGHYVRQQVRWNKSFIRESSWVLGTFPVRHGAFWLTLTEIVGWIIIGSLTLAGLVIAPFLVESRSFWLFVALTSSAAYARNASYVEHVRAEVGLRQRLAVLALAPLYAAIHIGLLLPIRFYALVTLRRGGWGTRRDIEVRLAPAGG